MIKKIFIGIVTAGMILTNIPVVNAEDEITLDDVTDQVIEISDKYNSAGVTKCCRKAPSFSCGDIGQFF